MTNVGLKPTIPRSRVTPRLFHQISQLGTPMVGTFLLVVFLADGFLSTSLNSLSTEGRELMAEQRSGVRDRVRRTSSEGHLPVLDT